MLGQLIQMTLMSGKDADASAVGDAEEQLKGSPKRNEQGSMRGKDEGEGEGEAAAISTSHAWKMQLIFLMRATCQWSSGAVGRQDGRTGIADRAKDGGQDTRGFQQWKLLTHSHPMPPPATTRLWLVCLAGFCYSCCWTCSFGCLGKLPSMDIVHFKNGKPQRILTYFIQMLQTSGLDS